MIIKIREIFKSPDELANGRVVLQGWVRTNRNSNKFGFLEVNDGTFFKSVQVVYETDKIDNFDIIAKSPIATALQIEGTLILTPDAKQPFEIKAERIEILAESSSDYPLQKKRNCPPASQEQYLCSGVQSEIAGCTRNTQILPR